MDNENALGKRIHIRFQECIIISVGKQKVVMLRHPRNESYMNKQFIVIGDYNPHNRKSTNRISRIYMSRNPT